ncbi:MAG TPA: FAD:protein FMN transferase [Candidatus Saccharimonadales bacterium]|nr:FAD:protein FMN transferase [Candidatus Saccharimonadales bacterium]
MLVHNRSETALGCGVTLVLVSAAGQPIIEDYFRRLWLSVFEFEQQCSRFLPGSELSQFNRSAGIRQAVSPSFRKVLAAAKGMAARSNGLYNPFILPALQRAGYVRSMLTAYKDDEVDNFSGRTIVPAAELTIGEDWASIPYGTAIDLGGCGKGYIGDRLADQADTFPELAGYWFSLGGDVITGGLDELGELWVVQVESAISDDEPSAVIRMPGPDRYAVATSSAVRMAPKIGRRHHHIIDPRTGKAAVSDISLATTYAHSALLADVFASCLIITGSADAQSYLEKCDLLGALLQTRHGAVVRIGALKETTMQLEEAGI